MVGVICKSRLTSSDVAEQVIKLVGNKKLKEAKISCKGDELRIWAKMHVAAYGQPEATKHIRDRAATKVIEYMYSEL